MDGICGLSLNSTTMPPRSWTIPSPKINLVVGMGDMIASNQSNANILTYSLGSCVGVVIYDPVVKVGGILHAMLPDSTLNEEKAHARPFMFVDTGLPSLFHAVYALGGVKSRIITKLAGGAELLNEKKVFNIGLRNVDAVHGMLKRNGVRLYAEDIGGADVRTLRLDLGTGNLTMDVTGKGSRLL